MAAQNLRKFRRRPVGQGELAESGVRKMIGRTDAAALDQSLLRRLSHNDRLAQIGVLAASMAHEINNPAAFILANSSVMKESLDVVGAVVSLLEEVTDQLPAEHAARVRHELSRMDAMTHLEELHEMVDDNLTGIKHIAKIVASLRTFARNDHDVAAVDIRKVVEAAIHMLAKKIRGRAKLVVDLQPVPLFTGEPTRLAQVVMNLLVNAVQAIDGPAADNSITVATRVKSGYCMLVVEDTGRGMTPDVQRRMFEPFYTTKADGEGTGLGLPLCRDIARQHGGQLHCMSFPGAGTRFELVIPLGKPPPPGPHTT